MKKRWGISNNFQVIVILLVFVITGFSTLYTHNFIGLILGVDDQTSVWIKTILFIFLILPIYTCLLYFWGFVFGQKQFFTSFIKLKLALIFNRKNKK